MNRSRRAGVLVVGLAAVALAASACGGGGSSGDAQSTVFPGAEALTKAEGVTAITFWHSMKSANADALNAMVATFNKKNADKIKVNAVFQGEYPDVVTKYKASVQQHKTPDLVQIYDIGTRFMVDSKQTVPAADFVAKDHHDMSSIEPNIANYYTLDGKLRSMPLNSSLPLLYINADAFKKAGLDPTKPPQTLDEIMAAAKKLTVKNANGQVKQYGFGAAIYGWLIEQLIAESGETYCNLENGRKGLATEVHFGGATGTKVATWWADMVKQGIATNTGRKTDDAQAAFQERDGGDEPRVDQCAEGLPRSHGGQVHTCDGALPEGRRQQRRRSDHRRRQPVDQRSRATATRRSAPPGSSRSSRHPPSNRRSGTPARDTSP
jgi:sn-glycerol 3-phosphate transport system substrate-binding protein